MIYSRIYFFIGIVFIAALQCLSPRVVVAGSQGPQYLIFQMFLGGPGGGDVFRRGATKDDMLQFARRIKDTVRPTSVHPNRILGFSIGPITMDEGENDVRSVIRDAFDVALATDMAVALHLDDYMMWAQARLPDGRLLRTVQGSAEWSDWSRTPAGRLQIGWLANAQLAPQLCYENPEVKDFTVHWTRDVIGREVRQQFDRLVQAGKEKLFAGVIIGWESNLAQGYCSLSYLGYSGRNPPADFDRERERILQRHIERWAKGIYDAGVPKERIFTHIGPIPRRAYEQMTAMMPRSRIREIPQSTAFRAYWTAFNVYSNPGFSVYPDQDSFEDIYQSLQRYGGRSWALAEGTNLTLGSPPTQSPLTWEGYLARSFNHGAAIVNLFGGFLGPGSGEFGRATESPEAIAAYRKFLRGDTLIENAAR